MDGIKRGRGVYTYRKDRDSKGIYYWIVDPKGDLLAYVETIAFARILVEHLNRS